MKVSESITLMALGAGELILDGWIFSMLWRWFAMPLGVRAVGIAMGVGVMQLVRFITSKRGQRIKTLEEGLTMLGHSIGFSLTSWVLGWILHAVAR